MLTGGEDSTCVTAPLLYNQSTNELSFLEDQTMMLSANNDALARALGIGQCIGCYQGMVSMVYRDLELITGLSDSHPYCEKNTIARTDQYSNSKYISKSRQQSRLMLTDIFLIFDALVAQLLVLLTQLACQSLI